jgi:gamma-glutamyltranspeptidase / glutathione hydrolase
MAGLPKGGPLKAHRPVVMGRRGVIATAHSLASEAGLMMLRQGGNAVDAVIAAAAALNVVEPYMSGMGGIGFALVSIGGKPPRMLNFSGCAPLAAIPEAYTGTEQTIGIKAPVVPGNPAGWLTLHETYGVLPREAVFAPAIELARDGYPISFLGARFFEGNSDLLAMQEEAAAVFLTGGKTFGAGDILRQPALADSLSALAQGGAAEFYEGSIGREIAEFCTRRGGLISVEDLHRYKPRWQDPLHTKFGDYTVYTTSPNSNAFQILETLNILEGFDLAGMGHNTASYLHHFIEAVKLSVTDRIAFCGDPDMADIPMWDIVAKAYADHRRALLNPEKAAVVSGERTTPATPPGALDAGRPSAFRSGETTHLSAADAAGNVVSITQTLGNAFGCGQVAGKTGILLNNIVNWFEIDAATGSRNLIAPGKRGASNMSPTQVFRNNRLCLSMGTPGSYGILQTTAQILVNALVFGMNVQEAIEAPRFRVMTGKEVAIEDRIDADVRAELVRRGHLLTLLGDWSVTVGGGQGIFVHPENGVMMAGADPRRDGYALGY